MDDVGTLTAERQQGLPVFVGGTFPHSDAFRAALLQKYRRDAFIIEPPQRHGIGRVERQEAVRECAATLRQKRTVHHGQTRPATFR